MAKGGQPKPGSTKRATQGGVGSAQAATRATSPTPGLPPPTPPLTPGRPRRVQITLSATPDYRDWAEGLARSLRVPLSVAVDHALAALAQGKGYPPPPSRQPAPLAKSEGPVVAAVPTASKPTPATASGT